MVLGLGSLGQNVTNLGIKPEKKKKRCNLDVTSPQLFFTSFLNIFLIFFLLNDIRNFPGGSVVKNLPASARDMGSVLELGRLPGEGNGNPLEYSCLGNPMDRGAWRVTIHGVTRLGQDLETKQQSNI